MKTIVAVSGKAGVGKTTTANLVQDQLILSGIKLTSVISPFAQGVKQIADEFGWDHNKDEKGRQLLINIGMMGRQYNSILWAEMVLKNVRKLEFEVDLFIIDDWRFPNEIKYLEENLPEYKFIKIRIEASNRESLKGTKQYFDESENSLPSIHASFEGSIYDLIADNSGSIEDLTKIVKCDIIPLLEIL